MIYIFLALMLLAALVLMALLWFNLRRMPDTNALQIISENQVELYNLIQGLVPLPNGHKETEELTHTIEAPELEPEKTDTVPPEPEVVKDEVPQGFIRNDNGTLSRAAEPKPKPKRKRSKRVVANAKHNS